MALVTARPLLVWLTHLLRAILDMKNQRDRLHQYQRKITVLTDKETDIARQMLAKGDKKRALLALRRKKYQESLLTKTDAQLAQLEKLTSDVEFALIQKDVVFGLQQGTKVLKEIHAEMGGIENVEKLMGETADAIAYQQVRCYDNVVRWKVSCLHISRKLAICSEGV
jgi:charged multivesicular body protein 6